jgi:hypothetical protein
MRAIDALYPESLADELEKLTEKLEQKHSLEALRDQVAQAPGGIIRHNGAEIRRSDLPRVIAELDREIAAVRATLREHDVACRSAHLAAARGLEHGWPDYLRGLAAVLHYADHSQANLRDAQGYVGNVYRVVTADGRVSSNELVRMVAACQQLYAPLARVYADVLQVTLDRTLLRRLEVESWPAMLEEFKLGPPSRENIGQWIEVIDGWVGACLYALDRVRNAALEQLLLAEDQVARLVRDQLPAGDAPPPSAVPAAYDTLLPGKERERQKRLDWWDRFQTADGVLPMIARSAVAVGIVGGVVVLGSAVGEATLTVYNALARPVTVEVAGRQVTARPLQAVQLSVPASGKVDVRALTADNQVIEAFEEQLHGANAHYVYNVASAAPLFEWTAVYSQNGNAPPSKERPLGTRRWSTTTVDHVFEEPPERIQISGSQGYREILSAASEALPFQQTDFVKNEDDRAQLIRAHLRWDATSSPHFMDWLQLGTTLPDFGQLMSARLEEGSKDVVLLRFEQDSTTGDAHAAVCERHGRLAGAAPSEPDLQYLAIRCMEDDHRQNAAFIAAHEKWPDHDWLALAAGATYAQNGDYAAAAPLYEKARKNLPPLRDYLAVQSARMRRLNAQGQYKLDDLAKQSRLVAAYGAVESGEGVEGTPLEPLAELARGDLRATLQKAELAGDARPRMQRLVAGSDGATPEMIEQAFALPVEDGADLESMFVMYGLAARMERDTAPYRQYIEKTLGDRGASAIAFIEQVRGGADPRAARASFTEADLGTRFNAFNAVVIMQGARAPMGWRNEVYRGLFVGERQYLVAAGPG